MSFELYLKEDCDHLVGFVFNYAIIKDVGRSLIKQTNIVEDPELDILYIGDDVELMPTRHTLYLHGLYIYNHNEQKILRLKTRFILHRYILLRIHIILILNFIYFNI